MNIQDQARQQLTKERLEDETLQEKLLSRSEEKLGEGQGESEQSRVLLAQERQDQENRQNTLLNRSIEEIQ
jgi:hypothetical protein